MQELSLKLMQPLELLCFPVTGLPNKRVVLWGANLSQCDIVSRITAPHLLVWNHVWHVLPKIPHYLLFHAACRQIPYMPHIKELHPDDWTRTCRFIHIQRASSPHNNPMSDTCHFEYRGKRRSKEIIIAVCLKCSAATQANFSSAALIAYMWNEITSHSVGGWGITFFTYTSISTLVFFVSNTFSTHSLLLTSHFPPPVTSFFTNPP